MSGRIVVRPDENLIETIAACLEGGGRDFSRMAVVFPGRRPAHFLRKELARRVRGSFIPPPIFSVDDFILSLYRRLNQEVKNELEKIDAVILLHQIHCTMNDRLGGDYFTSLDSFIPAGLKLFGELEDLRLADLPDRRLKEVLSSLTYNRLFALADYYEKFYELVVKKGFTTRAVRYTEVARRINEINLDDYDRLIVAGLFRLTQAERTIFDELEKRPHTQFVYQTDEAETGVQGPEIYFYEAPDTHGQTFALSAIIKGQKENNKTLDERSVVVLPAAEALFPVVHQTLSLLDQEQYNIALGYPIGHTPVYSFLHNLMELVCTKAGGRYSAAKYVKFILHPYTKNIRFDHRTDVTRVLFHSIESKLAEDKSHILLALEDIEQEDQIFTDVAFAVSDSNSEIAPERLKEHLQSIHKHTIRVFENISSLKDFAYKAIEVLGYIYEQSTAYLHPLFRPYAESLLQVFMQLEQSLAGSASFNDPGGYLNFLKKFVALQEVPFAGTPLRGLQVLGMLETRNLKFEDVYVLDVNDTILPGSIGHDMLLPQQLREKLGLETRQDRDKLMEYYFNLLVRGAKRVHLFFTKSVESDRSRFVEKLLWERQKQDKTYTADKYINTVRYQVKLSNDAVFSIAKSKEVLARLNRLTYSASALDTYLQCPVKFYYRYLMHLEEKEEATDDLDSRDIGKFVHEVLKKFYEPLVGKKLETRDLDPERMGQLIDESFTQKFGMEHVGAMYLLKQQIRRRLRAMLTDYQQQVLETSDVVLKGLEEKLSVQALGVRFEGRIDRIEQRGDTVVILDYKTGAKPTKAQINFSKLNLDERGSWNEAVTSLQLPVYLLLYNIRTGIAMDKIVPAYVYLGENRLSKESEVPFLEDAAERTERFSQVQKIIELLLREIHDPAVPFLPPEDLGRTCPHCPYTGLCGTNWVRGWRK